MPIQHFRHVGEMDGAVRSEESPKKGWPERGRREKRERRERARRKEKGEVRRQVRE
jgi:hypothetical protein